MERSYAERLRPLAALAVAVTAAAATPVSADSSVRTKSALTLDGARQVIAAGIAYARAHSAPGGVIAVVDDGGNLVAVERLDGTFAAGANVSIGKARTAALFRKPTKFFEDVVNKGRTAMTALPEFTPLQGGVPIVSGSEVVGAVGVSGAASAQQDEEIALAGAAALASPASSSEVLYYDSRTVGSAFDKGSVLFGGDGGRGYMVHASRRDKAGAAEIHTLDTDIIHVLDGTATFVTGGSVEDAKEVEPNELRGAAIAGGQRRQLAKGDVVIVPAGVPHWFAEVPGTLLYYVVKVRR